MHREYNVERLLETLNPYLPLEGLDPHEWLLWDDNIALTDGLGNYSLFQGELPGLVTGHYFFKARGREAIDVAQDMLSEIFQGPYGVDVIQGFTPIHYLGAKWLNTRLGFKSYGIVDMSNGPHELVILTKKEWELLHG